MNPSRRSFTRLALLSCAAFSLRPREALARTDLKPDFSASLLSGRLKLSFAVDNHGAPIEVGIRGTPITLSIINGDETTPLSAWELEFTSLGMLAASERERMSRAGPRTRYSNLPTGRTSLGEAEIDWPEGVTVDENTRLSISISSGHLLVSDTISVTLEQS